MDGDDLSWRVEQACLNAYPSPRQVLLDGWLLRLSGGPIRRTKSVNPLRGARADLAAVAEDCARVYAAAGLPLLFRVPAIADGMGAALDRLGFAARGETCTLLADLASAEAAPDPAVELRPDPDEGWLAARAAVAGDDAAADAIYRRMVGVIALPKAFAALRVDGTVAALAYGALDRGLLVIESVATAERFRQRGFGTRTVGRLMGWARAQGARGACLQVTADNRPARALYAGLGFGRELYRYHYRGTGAAG